MDAYPPPPPKTNAAEGEAVAEERKMKSWSKPVIRHLGQTVYTATGPTALAGKGENNMYMPPTS